MTALFAFLHHLAAFTLFAALVVEFLLTKGELTLANARRILLADVLFGVSAGIVLVVGFIRVFYLEKGAAYYFHNGAFHAKLTLFVLIGLLSIYPTVKFLSWRPALRSGSVPAVDAATLHRIRMLIHSELAALVLLILCATLMARGIGSFG